MDYRELLSATLIKEKHLIGFGCIFKGLVHYHHGETWWHRGRHGSGEAAENSTS